MNLSIITINYNNLEGLKNTYKSIVEQTYKDYEWIVIDGGSTDGSKEFIEQNTDKFAYWCSEPDSGVYNAMNKGVGKAKGNYINFMNSGDIYASNDVIEKFINCKYQADIQYGDVIYRGESGDKTIVYPDTLLYNRFPKYTINHQATFIKRELAKRFPYDTKYKLAADRKFWTESLLHGATFKHLNFIVSIYDYSGMSSLYPEKVKKECELIYKEVVPHGLSLLLEELEQKRTMFNYNPELEQIYVLINKRRFYKRIIQSVIKFLTLIE